MLKLILLLYRVVSVIGGHQRKLGPDVEDNFVVGDSRIWKCLGKGNVKTTHACLVATYRNVSTNDVKPWML